MGLDMIHAIEPDVPQRIVSDLARLGHLDISRRNDAPGDLSRVLVTMASEVFSARKTQRKTISLMKGGFLLVLIGVLWG